MKNLIFTISTKMVLPLFIIILFSGSIFSQCACVSKKQYCSSGYFQATRDIGESCMDVSIDVNDCAGGCTGLPFAQVTANGTANLEEGTYPARFCDLFNNAVPGTWTFTKVDVGSLIYRITYQGPSEVTRVRFGDNVLDGPNVTMTPW